MLWSCLAVEPERGGAASHKPLGEQCARCAQAGLDDSLDEFFMKFWVAAIAGAMSQFWPFTTRDHF